MKKRLLQIALFAAAGCFMLGGSGPICPKKEPPSGTRPEVTYMYPNDGDTNVRLDQAIVVNFSKPMDTTSTEKAFDIKPPATGTFTWSNDHKSLSFQPDSDLQPDTSYTVTVEASAESQEGWKMESSRQATWTTKP